MPWWSRAYNSGRCHKSAEYSVKVLTERAALRAFARTAERAPERLARFRDAAASHLMTGAVARNEHAPRTRSVTTMQ